MKNRSGAWYIRTAFRNSGRYAGDGILSDDYSEDSCSHPLGNGDYTCRLPNDGEKPEDLNGPVIIVQAGKDVI